ncbi:MAG TPA: hypothetical protein VEL28_13780 [Candidatus Binatia bacterium]|nr:hypothetical protein [Candidatus Binatia bacterium]
MDLHLRSNVIFRLLLATAGAVTVAHVAAQASTVAGVSSRHPLVQALNMDNEPSIPTLVAIAHWAVCLMLAACIAFREHVVAGSHRRAWTTLSCVLAYLLADEQLGLHEAIADFLATPDRPQAVRAAWVLPYGVVAVVAAAAAWRVLADLPRSVRRWMAASGVAFAAGAIGVELLGGRYIASHGHDLFYHLTLVPAEELLEMVGLALLARGLLEYVARVQPVIRLRVE